MKNLPKLFLSSAIILCLFTACKKGSSNKNTSSSYYVNFKANGSQHKDTKLAAGVQAHVGAYYSTAITGATATSSNSEKFTIVIASSALPAANTTYGITPDDNGSNFTELTYTTTDSKLYTSGDGVNGSTGTVTITSVSSNTLKGTFSGKLVNADNSDDSITVTEGEFYIPYTFATAGVAKHNKITLSVKLK